MAGFIGVNDAQVEMLFVDPERFGQRVGTRLLDHVRAKHARLTVDVNEQNPGAHAFYAATASGTSDARRRIPPAGRFR
nr:GNAT family N-acetyltransferase [Burkholderia ubonensis]